MTKYYINYSQTGGKELDYLLYRYLNSFINDKKKSLDIINFFTYGFNYPDNIDQLQQILRDNKIEEAKNKKIIDGLTNIFDKSIYNGIKIFNSYITTFDLSYFNTLINRFIQTNTETIELIEKFPNFLIKANMKSYLELLFNNRSERTMKNYIFEYNLIKLEDIIMKKYPGRNLFGSDGEIGVIYKNIFKSEKKLDDFRELRKEKIISLNGNTNEAEHNKFSFQVNDSIDELMQQELIKYSKKKNIFLYIDTYIFQAKLKEFNDNNLTFTKVNLHTYTVSISETTNIKKNKALIINLLKEVKSFKILSYNSFKLSDDEKTEEKKFIELKSKKDSSFPELKQKLFNSLSYESLFIESKNKEREMGRISSKIGEDYEQKILFLSALKICLDNKLDLKKIRIYLNCFIKHKQSQVKDDIHEIDLIILDENNKIISIGEIKKNLEDANDGYAQLNIRKEKLLDFSNYRIYHDKKCINKIYIKGISQQLLLKLNEPVENNPLFYLILNERMTLLGMSEYNLKIFRRRIILNNLIKLDLSTNQFIINEGIIDSTYADLIEQFKFDMENKKIDIFKDFLSVNIIEKYRGKNNLLIFKEDISKLIEMEYIIDRYLSL